MGWIEQMTRGLRGGASRGDANGPAHNEPRTRDTMLRAITFALDHRDSELGIVDHCARVAANVSVLGRQLLVSEGDDYLLRTAAQLHELGMFAVPRPLLLRAAPLTAAELEEVRGQARLSAEVAAMMHHPRVARLIAHQYDDHATLRDRLSVHDLLLAGIFRVADVLAAVTAPRPYQDPLPRETRLDLLRSGAGTRFHPDAVRYALQLTDR